MSSVAARVAVVLSFLSGCQQADLRFSSPAATFGTYRQAIVAADAGAAWACLSSGYRQLEFGGSFERWRDTLAMRQDYFLGDLQRREIAQEHEINGRLGYLQFDASTLVERASPFFYFLHEPDGWKITSHLDSLFRVELEGAIDRGEFQLPRR